MDDFYAARTTNMAALPWSNFAPPFSGDIATFIRGNWLDGEQVDGQTVLSIGERLIERRPASDWPAGMEPVEQTFDDTETTDQSAAD